MYKAVVVDDEDLVREAIIALGRWRDFGIDKVLEANNAKTALELFEKELPDIVVTDMKMPVMDGLELLRVLGLNHAHIKVIVVSGFSDYEYTRQAIRSNVVDYILKPVDSRELNNAIAACISLLEDLNGEKNTLGNEKYEYIEKNVILEIESYVKEHYPDDITLDELSRRFFVSKEHISRSFKKQLNMNLFEYITMLRLDKAKELLLKTSFSLEEIAERVGFSNGNYFSKAFRKQTDTSPSDFRNQKFRG